MPPDLGSLAINGGLAFLSFLTVFLFNNIWKTLQEHGKRISKIEQQQAVHAERHSHCKCSGREAE
jgi:hypothetical protein